MEKKEINKKIPEIVEKAEREIYDILMKLQNDTKLKVDKIEKKKSTLIGKYDDDWCGIDIKFKFKLPFRY